MIGSCKNCTAFSHTPTEPKRVQGRDPTSLDAFAVGELPTGESHLHDAPARRRPRVRRRKEARAFRESPIRRNSSPSRKGARHPSTTPPQLPSPAQSFGDLTFSLHFGGFRIGLFGPRQARITQFFAHEHARTCINMQFCHMCKHGYKGRNDCPHAYPQSFPWWIRAVENLWILWIKVV